MFFWNAVNPLKALHSAELPGDSGVVVSSGCGFSNRVSPVLSRYRQTEVFLEEFGVGFRCIWHGTYSVLQLRVSGFDDLFRELQFAVLPLHLQTCSTPDILVARKLQCE